MSFLNLFKNLFFNEEIKSVLPLIVSIACFFIVRNLFVFFVSRKKIKISLINLFAVAVTVIAYFSFINILQLARYTYIFDSLPFIFYLVGILLICLKELTFGLYLLISSNILKVSFINYYNSCEIFIFYETIKCLVISLRFKIELIANQILFLVQKSFYKHTQIYKLNCSFSC